LLLSLYHVRLSYEILKYNTIQYSVTGLASLYMFTRKRYWK